MVLIGILRYFVSKLMCSFQFPNPKIVKEGQVILRARNLRVAANFIPSKSFRSRRVYFNNEENGLLFVPKGHAQNAQAQLLQNVNEDTGDMFADLMKHYGEVVFRKDDRKPPSQAASLISRRALAGTAGILLFSISIFYF
ncbi:hypothetical protein HRI_000119400 [Hibiscus trionum]|uniref:Uncharacterized protein n=1 Tax=Hibiscus trionum TaxID=183268 RepID=A0A9W7GTA8_HIBTR|nr:hypothetical protein HRI_000119400 [Hibiscus trionum]